MPQVRKAETFDGVSAPALPLGWSASPGFQTSNSLSRSTPNSLRYFAPGGGGGTCYWPGADDGASGNARVTVSLYFGGVTAEAQWQPVLRYHPAGPTYYALILEPAGSALAGLSLWKVVNGVYTQLGSALGAAQFAAGVWYRVQLTAAGNTLLYAVQRLSDNQWFNGGGWQAAAPPPPLTLDGAITGAGYAGLLAYQDVRENNPLYADDFLFENLQPDPGALLKRRRRPPPPAVVKRMRKRGWQAFYPALRPPPPTNDGFWQFNTAGFCGVAQECLPFVPDPASQPVLCRYGIRGGPVVSVPSTTGLAHTSESVNLTDWPAGTWVARLNVVGDPPTLGVKWDAVYICRVNAQCQNQGAVASVTGLNLNIDAPGTYAVSLQGSEQQGASVTDAFYLYYGFINTGPPGQNVGVQLDQLITTPFDYFTPIDTFVPDRIWLKHSAGLRQAKIASLRRKFRIPPALLTPQPPATGPFDPSLFRRRKRFPWTLTHRDNTPYPRGGHFLRGISGVLPGLLSLPAPLPDALRPRPRKRRPATARKYRRLPRWVPLAPIFLGADKAMVATAVVLENLQAAGQVLESLPGTAVVTETMRAQGASVQALPTTTLGHPWPRLF